MVNESEPGASASSPTQAQRPNCLSHPLLPSQAAGRELVRSGAANTGIDVEGRTKVREVGLIAKSGGEMWAHPCGSAISAGSPKSCRGGQAWLGSQGDAPAALASPWRR